MISSGDGALSATRFFESRILSLKLCVYNFESIAKGLSPRGPYEPY